MNTTTPPPDRREASREAFEALMEANRETTKRDTIGSYAAVVTSMKWQYWCAALDWHASQQPDLSALRAEEKRIAGHIKQPLTAQEIAARLQSDDYCSEQILHHLLRLVADGAQQISSPEGQRAPCPEAGNDGDALACPPSGGDCIEPQPDWRPLEPGEIIQEGDQLQSNPVYVENARWRDCVDSVGKTPEDFQALEFRTRRPKPTTEPPCFINNRQTCPDCDLPHTGDHACKTDPQSAVEWVEQRRTVIICDDGDMNALSIVDALKLAERCDAAEAGYNTYGAKCAELERTLQATRNTAQKQGIDNLAWISEVTELKKQLAAAQAEAREYRETLKTVQRNTYQTSLIGILASNALKKHQPTTTPE